MSARKRTSMQWLRREPRAIDLEELGYDSDNDDTLPEMAASSAEVAEAADATPKLNILQIPTDDFARQLTLIDQKNFSDIAEEELMGTAWLKKEKFSLAPGVVAMTRRFNHVSFWAVREILHAESNQERAEKLLKFIKIAKKLHEYNNLHSLLAILSGLLSAPVYRLKKTWKRLKDKHQDLFEVLKTFMSEGENHKAAREHLKSTKLPCIPYLGMYLTDLIHIETAMGSSPNPEIKEQRLQERNAIINEIKHFQQSTYSFSYIGFIRDYLLSFKYVEELQKMLDDEHYNLSLLIEPKKDSDCSDHESDAEDEAKLPTAPGSNRLSAFASQLKGFSAKGSLPFRLRTPVRATSKPPFAHRGHRKTKSLGTTANFFEIRSLAQTEDDHSLLDGQSILVAAKRSTPASPRRLFSPQPSSPSRRRDTAGSPISFGSPNSRFGAARNSPRRSRRESTTSTSSVVINNVDDQDTSLPWEHNPSEAAVAPSNPFAEDIAFGSDHGNSSDDDDDSLFEVEVEAADDPSLVASQPFEPDESDKEGFLYRVRTRSMVFRSSVPHWVALTGSTLHLFKQRSRAKGRTDRQAFEALPATSLVLADLAVMIDPSTRHPSFSIRIQTSGLFIKFVSQTVTERDDWVRVLSTLAAQSHVSELGPFTPSRNQRSNQSSESREVRTIMVQSYQTASSSSRPLSPGSNGSRSPTLAHKKAQSS